MISIRGVSHSIGGGRILQDINLDLPRGGVTALIGPNGAGKSTLLSLVARLQKLKTGRIRVDDLEIGACPDATLARVLAIMP
jgi:iron complex transport system ATP-binding protein